MIIAVTYSDEVNMIACQVAHSLFDVPTKVARVRAQSYLSSQYNDLYSRENMPIDIIISPEIEIGRAILRRLNTPGAFNVVSFSEGRVQMLGVKIGEECPIIDTPIKQIPDLFQGLHAAIVGIKRDGEIFAPLPDDPLNVGDEAYFITESEHSSRLLEIIGARDNMVICLTNDDKTNILSAVLAKKLGADHTISLINEVSMQDMQSELGIDMVIDPRASTISSILRHVRRGRILDVYSLEQGRAEIMEGEVLETSPLSGKSLREAGVIDGIAIGAVIHNGKVMLPTPDLVVKTGDQLVLLAEKSAMKDIEQMFRVSMDYF